MGGSFRVDIDDTQQSGGALHPRLLSGDAFSVFLQQLFKGWERLVIKLN